MFAEVNSLSIDYKILAVVLSFLGFTLTFVGSWLFFMKHHQRFTGLTQAMKADTCSRVNSTLHSIIIVPGLLHGILNMKWNEWYQPEASVMQLQIFLCITIGYFACDTVILFMYKTPLWIVFVVHHVIASCPYVVYLFIASCPDGLFILSMFLLVEFTNISLNAQAFLEQNGLGNSKYYAMSFYFTFVSWIFCRIANPIFLVVTIHTKVFPSMKHCGGNTNCLIPGAICAWLISFFCIGVFVAVLCKELYMRWKTVPSIGLEDEDVAKVDETRPHFDQGHIHLSQDETDITARDPVRTFVFEAREVAHEIEEKVIDLERKHVGRLGDLTARRRNTSSDENSSAERTELMPATSRPPSTS